MLPLLLDTKAQTNLPHEQSATSIGPRRGGTARRTLLPRGARVSPARGVVILPLLLQESGEVVRAEPGVEEHLAVVLGDPAPQLDVDRDLALARLR